MVDAALIRARQDTMGPSDLRRLGVTVRQDGQPRNVLDLLGSPELSPDVVEQLFPWLRELPPRARAHLDVEALYAGYLPRQEADIRAFRREESVLLGRDIDYERVGGLSAELVEKLRIVRPGSLGAAARVEGMTPAAIAALMGHLRSKNARFT
jgi:tRNA uridine 5-carboxymethylaminomethyl modification enzyme